MAKTQMMIVAIGLFFLLVGATVMVSSIPNFPSQFTPGLTTRYSFNNYGQQSHAAGAGNITALFVYSISQTNGWQGYYGNISGTIVLDDANNYTFYNWSSAEPRGEIYATLGTSILWDNVTCFNFSQNTTIANHVTIENYYGFATDDVDGTNETFAFTDHPVFQVGSRSMDDCPTTYIYQNDTIQTSNFVNVLLYDPLDNVTGWIYTALIENKTAGSSNDLTCYNGQPCDFQILVNENGHGTDTATTTYYFWVELT